jgi:hypothetical protein
MVERCHDEVQRALASVAQLFAGENEVFLARVQAVLTVNLSQMPRLRGVVEEAVALGGTTLDAEGFFRAMAVWIVDNQLQDGLYWEPAKELRRRGPQAG